MHRCGISRTHFGHLHPFVLGEVRGYPNKLIFDRARRGDIEGRGHFENDVGLGNLPAMRKCSRGRRVDAPAFECTAIHPRDDLLLSRQEASDKSFENLPYFGSGDQGGILPASTAARIAFAHGRTSSKRRSDARSELRRDDDNPGIDSAESALCLYEMLRVIPAACVSPACAADPSAINHRIRVSITPPSLSHRSERRSPVCVTAQARPPPPPPPAGLPPPVAPPAWDRPTGRVGPPTGRWPGHPAHTCC